MDKLKATRYTLLLLLILFISFFFFFLFLYLLFLSSLIMLSFSSLPQLLLIDFILFLTFSFLQILSLYLLCIFFNFHLINFDIADNFNRFEIIQFSMVLIIFQSFLPFFQPYTFVFFGYSNIEFSLHL